MAGVDTIRGIAYQQAQAVLAVLELLEDPDLGSLRVEGVDDIVDVEVFAAGGLLRRAMQIKVRAQEYTWGKAELTAVLRRWAALPDAVHASFEFVTDGRLGPSGQEVADALAAAGTARVDVLAEILEERVDSPVCVALTNARVRLDPTSAEALLSRAERQVCAMLPSPRTAADAREQAGHAVDRLFRALFARASDAEPRERLLGRAELAEILGVPADQAAAQRWPGQLRDIYLRNARSGDLDNLVPALVTAQTPSSPMIRRAGGEVGSIPQTVTALRRGGSPSVLAGPTGMGKSTAGKLLRRDAANDGSVVLYAHAEGYLPDRLAALAADAISDVVGQDLPSSTGRQALADSAVTLVIDGVSEVPDEVRQGLQAELRAPLGAGRGAHIVLLGRDVAVLRATLPSSSVPEIYQLVELDAQRRLDLACRVLCGTSADDNNIAHQLPAIRWQLTRAEKPLGDAAGNPMLLAMALTLASEGAVFTDRASLYQAFVEHLAERSGAMDIAQTAAALGITFAALLNEGRRYSNPIEWQRLLTEAVETLRLKGISASKDGVDATARRCGLVVPLGWAQTLVPVHDSFADYLAGSAHANRLTQLPDQLRPNDEQRIVFSAEVGGVGKTLAARVARDLPFLTVDLALHERRGLAEDAPAEIERLLRLLDVDHGYGVALWQTTDGRTVALRRRDRVSEWIDEADARALIKHTPAVILERPGPLEVAVRIWRQGLVLRLARTKTLPLPQPASLDQACVVLRDHVTNAAAATRELISATAPPGQGSKLGTLIGPLGLNARVHSAEQHFGGTLWPVSYRSSDAVCVSEALSDGPDAATNWKDWGDGTVEGFTRYSAGDEAANRVRKAIEKLTYNGWLAP